MPTCFYCGSLGPFSNEHVFPYSLGGGGDGWTLIDEVCVDCNNLFSGLERELGRRSIESLVRTAYGPEGRKRKKGTEKRVPLYADGIYLYPDDSDLVFEAGVEFGMQAYVRPQIVAVSASEVAIMAEGPHQVDPLFERVRNFLEKDFFIITQQPTKKGDPFRVLQLQYERPKTVTQVGALDLSKPAGAWLESLPADEKGRRFTPRIFTDDEGRLVIRARSVEDAVKFLGPVTEALTDRGTEISTSLKARPVESTGKGPQIGIYQSLRLAMIFRAIAKVGMNFALKAYGSDFVRRPEFTQIKEFILGQRDTGMNEAGKHVTMIGDQTPFGVFKVTPDEHWLMLTFQPPWILFAVQLYGQGGYVVRLGEVQPPYSTAGFEVATVDYSARQCRMMSPVDLLGLIRVPGSPS